MKKTNNRNLINQISRSALIFCGVLLLFLSYGLKVKAAGGTFYHVHTEACYESVEVPCTDHSIHIHTVSSSGYCPYCDKTCGTFVMDYNEVCSVTGMSTVVDVVTTCQECTNIISTSPRSGLSKHTKTQTNMICGKTEETAIATVSFTKSTGEITTSPVTISAEVNVLDAEFNLSGVTYSHDGGVTWGAESSKSYSENGTYSIAVKDARGTSFSEIFTIDNIVKPTPSPTPKPVPTKAPTPTAAPTVEDPTNMETEPVLEDEVKDVVGNAEDDTEPRSTEKSKESQKDDATMMQEENEENVPDITVPEFSSADKESRARAVLAYDITNPQMYLETKIQDYSISTDVKTETIQESMLGMSSENQSSEMPKVVQEASITYVLSSVYVKVLYLIGGILLLVAFLGAIWYAYRNAMILYEVEDKERFFLAILFAKGTRERKVYISEKQINKVATKEILLTCFRQEKEKQIAIYTPTEKYRKPWKKEIRIRI